ncbi:ABC transporter permease [Paenibacillus sp. CC-CFT747]|nr:ABC transporter permease [Paenibacillus sp. CC-CFT747]
MAQTAKVFVKKNAFANAGKAQAGVQLMGIDTDEFGRTAWLRDNLLDHSFYDYLNLIASDPSAVLISRSLAEEANLKPGDTLRVGWAGLEGASFLVYGIIDYWPGWNPNGASQASGGTTAKAGNAKKRDLPKLVVGHLSYIQNNLALEPYEVWLKLKPGTTSAELYRQLEEKELHPVELTDTKQLLIRQKNDPFQLAINGVLTLGFLISILISFFGFLLYWLLSLSARTLQIGILRAMGLSFPQLAGMLAAEQLLTSGAAVLIGLFTGTLASRLFVPIFKISFNTAQQMLPFQVVFDPRDQLQLYLITGAMILIGLVLLGYMLSRIKIHQAVKLGED